MALTASVQAQTINVLRLAPPGAGTAAWAEAISQTLTENGYRTNIVGFKNCQEGAKWLKDNPKEPVVAMNFSDPFLLNIAEPSNPAGCNFPINQESLVAVAGKWYHFICGHADAGGLKGLLASDGAKVGSWNSPVQMKIVKDQLTDIGVKNFKVIGYAAGKDQLQSFVSRDTDYIILSSESLAKGLPNATCFATSAEPAIAAGMERTSYTELNPKVRHQDSGLWPIIVGYNVDIKNIRDILGPTGNQGLLQQALNKNYIPVFDSIEVQLRDINQRAASIKE